MWEARKGDNMVHTLRKRKKIISEKEQGDSRKEKKQKRVEEGK